MMQQACPHCGNEITIAPPIELEVHLNPSGQLPPVHCPLVILVDGKLLRAERTGIISDKSRQMEYRLADGSVISGRYQWTYP